MLKRNFDILLLSVLMASIPLGRVYGYGYEIWYGNVDGAPLAVGLDQVVDIPCWISTAEGNLVDSLAFVHNPLASNDTIIAGRLGGSFVAPFTGWEDISFMSPNTNNGGYTNQSVLGFADFPAPPNTSPVNTNGVAILFGYYRMRTAADPSLNGRTVFPFREGLQQVNGSCYWGNQGGTIQWDPIQHYGSLYFSPESATDDETLLPTETALGQNFPNPFNPSTSLRLALAEAGQVEIAVYDIAGRKVRTLLSGHLGAGYHDITWDGRDEAGRAVPSGVYFARLIAGGKSAVVKMTMLK